jgi:Glycosyl transferase 4-like domain
MRKVLIVSPRFPPTNAADLHRVRVSLAHYRRFGWDSTILCLDPETSDSPLDPALAEALPQNIRVTRVRAWSERFCRRFGFGQLGYRSLLPLYRTGCELLKQEHHDVVFFSTTVFLSFLLGPLWKRRFGCKIVYDFQDPWYSEQPLYTRDTVPGSWWKYRLDRWMARYLERFALTAADHIISVSDGYVRSLSHRYARLESSRFTVLPFSAPSDDYDFVRMHSIRQAVFQPNSGLVHWVYAGRAGPDMDPILSVLFQSLAAFKTKDADFIARLRLHFVGTNYASAARTYKLVEPLAHAHGVQDLVEELSTRVPYFQTISLYDASDAVLLIGSIHADYTASKLLPCILSKKPILALFHRQSLISRIARQFSNVFLATFDQNPSEPLFHVQVAKGIEWLCAPTFDPLAVDLALKSWSAEESTRAQCAIFDRISWPASPS